MRALAPRFRGFPPAHRHVDEDADELVESRPTARAPVVGHRGASDRLLRRARHLLDPGEAFALSDAGRFIEQIRDRVRNLGPEYADAVVAMWEHIYAGGPSPKGALATASAERTWRAWFAAEGLAPLGIGATSDEGRPIQTALEPPELPSTASRAWAEISQAWSDVQTRQQALVEAWRAAQLRELRRLWADGYQEGVSAFAEQYPELLTDDLLAEFDAEDDENEDQLAPHYASIGKMVGQLTNLLMLAPAAPQIAKWFDDNAHRVHSQAETLAWQAEQTGYRQAGANFGLTIEWESEGDERVCEDCAALEAAGPYTSEEGDNPLPAFPGDGSTECGPNCRCSLNYLEPDEPSLGQAEAIDQADAGDLVALSSEAIPGALGVEALDDLEGGSMVDTFREIARRARNRDIEIAFALSRKGRILASALGDANSVNFTEAQLKDQYGAAMVLHNHPLSVSFSPTDVAFAFSQAVGEMRVVSPEWDYKLKPIGKRFVPSEVTKVIDAAQEQVDQLYPEVKQKAVDAYHAQFSTPDAEHLSYAEHFRLQSVNFWHEVWSKTAADTKLFKYERTVAPKLEQMVHVQPATVTKAHIEQEHLKPIGQMPLSFPKNEAQLLVLPKDVGPSGANEGWWKKSATGERYYVKPMTTERAANEVGAMRVYEAYGAIPGKDIPYVRVVNRIDDKPVVVSRYVEETLPKSASWWEHPASDPAKTDARRFWAVDALLSHYDVVGANPAKGFDNLIVRSGVGAFRVEGGGAMQFSGLGVQKAGWKVGAPWVEPWTMRGLAHDGIPGGATVKPVFASISDEKAAELLGQLQHLDRDALAAAWLEAGMKANDIIENLAVINSRIAQIPTIQEQLGFKVAAKVAPAPPATIASKVVYKKWNPTTDKYGKLLAVQHKAFFEDFKKFNPIAGKASKVVEELATGVTFPAYAIKQGEAKIARLKLRVAFARSYNYALGVPVIPGLNVAPTVQEFWKVKLGLVETTKSVDVPHVISTWLPKPADHPPVHTIATAISKWDQVNDPLGVDFRAAHPDWYAALEKEPLAVQNAVVAFGGGSYSKGFALTYNDYLHGSPMLKAGAAPEVEKFWKTVLGDLPAQPESLQSVATTTAHDAAIKAAIAGPYDDVLAFAKDEISKGGEPEDALSNLAYLLTAKGDHLDTDELIHGLVKFGLVGDDASAANLVADWMVSASEIAESLTPDLSKLETEWHAQMPGSFKVWYDAWTKGLPMEGDIGPIAPQSGAGQWFIAHGIPVESGPIWLKPDADAFAQFKQEKVAGTSVPSLHDFQDAYADWVAGGDQASWMPTPVTKWFDVNMVKPGAVVAKVPTVENFNAAFPSAKADAEKVGDWLAQWASSVKDPGWGFTMLPQNVQAYLKSLGITNEEQLATASAKFGSANFGLKTAPDLSALKAAWHYNQPFEPFYEAWTTGKPVAGTEAPIKPGSPAAAFFEAHGVASGAPLAPALIEYATALLPGIEAVSVTKVDQLYGLLKVDWPSMASSLSPGDLGKVIADYQAGKATEAWTAWFQAHAPEIEVAGKDVGQKEVAAVTFTKQTTLLAWSPTNDKWAKKFGKAHPKLYNSFKVFQAKPWVAEITKDLQFPAYAQKNTVKLARLRLKVALARTYNMAVQGKYAELGALDPKLPIFWKAKLGALGVEAKVGPVDASLANLNATKDLLRTTQGSWYPDFRSTFGHTVTLKIVPEFADAAIAIPENSTRERELRALGYAKSYLMAKAGDVAGLKAIDERLLYFWDEKLGGGLVPKVAVSLEGAPWVHDLNALYSRSHQDTTALVAKYTRSTRANDYKNFSRGIAAFTGSSNVDIREAGKSILHGGVGGRYGSMAKALIEAVQDAPATAPQLFRHESWESVARRAGSTRQGLEAFLSQKVGTDYTFTMDLVSTQYAGHWQGDLEWVIEPGAKAIFAQPLSSHYSENEFITAGRFKILSVKQEGGKLVVRVRQVGVFDQPD